MVLSINFEPTIYEVKCPKCYAEREYSPKKPTTNVEHANFTCKKCKHRSSVWSNRIVSKKNVGKSKGNSKKGKKKGRKRNTKPKKSQKKVKSVPKRELLPLPLIDPGFLWFARWVSFPHYRGLFNWQEEHEALTKNAKYEMTLVPRDHGKSVKYTQKYQHQMWYKGYDVLLLGWTDRRKEIALFVYTFFNKYGLIETDRRTSPFHFRLVNGAKFDCYLITGKEALGMHSLGKEERFSNLTPQDIIDLKSAYDPKELMNMEDGIFDDKAFEKFIADRNRERKLWISIDDPIDIGFMKERWKEEDLELRFSSTLYSINPDKWSFTGTHKFEGDIFDFWIGRFGKKLVIYKKPPILPDGSLLCPEMFTHPSLSTYNEDIKTFTIDPKTQKKVDKTPKKDLDEIRHHIGEYAWSSDWCQEPHPVTGDIWDHVDFINMLDTPVDIKHDICFITVDRATTRKIEATTKKADYTGCLIGLRHKKTGFKIITHDFTDYIDIDNLLLILNDFIIEFHAKHEHMTLILIVETQGGGSDFVTLVRNSAQFIRDDGTLVTNKLRELCYIFELHNRTEKLQRIKDRLGPPLKNLLYKFLSTLKKAPIINQILSYPNCNKFDAIDSLANVEFILLEEFPYNPGGKDNVDAMLDLYKQYEDGTLDDNIDERAMDFQEVLFNKFAKEKRRNVF